MQPNISKEEIEKFENKIKELEKRISDGQYVLSRVKAQLKNLRTQFKNYSRVYEMEYKSGSSASDGDL